MTTRKQKEKALFTVKWTRTRQTRVTKSVLRRFGLLTLGAALLIAIGIGSGGFKFAAGVVRCGGLPVESISFLSKTLKMPGDEGYGLSPFATYQYCTREQAQAAGFGPVVLSEAQKQELEAKRLAREEAKRFSPEKIDYTVYAPVADGYEVSDIYLSQISSIHTFFKIKKNGTVVGSVRELPVDDPYNICSPSDNPAKDYCEVIGHDTSGREIKRSYHKGVKGWSSRTVGINIDGTGIILSSDDDTEALLILGSLEPYVGGGN
ncbi:hypothetical protein BGO17_03570 [Candidatus Saccharibacteria bacterium 49-20]|nr:MAG: hypothetical protein BGO17_03570 [Candidatus Saccharibacteria bacterium 49-20]